MREGWRREATRGRGAPAQGAHASTAVPAAAATAPLQRLHGAVHGAAGRRLCPNAAGCSTRATSSATCPTHNRACSLEAGARTGWSQQQSACLQQQEMTEAASTRALPGPMHVKTAVPAIDRPGCRQGAGGPALTHDPGHVPPRQAQEVRQWVDLAQVGRHTPLVRGLPVCSRCCRHCVRLILWCRCVLLRCLDRLDLPAYRVDICRLQVHRGQRGTPGGGIAGEPGRHCGGGGAGMGRRGRARHSGRRVVHRIVRCQSAARPFSKAGRLVS